MSESDVTSIVYEVKIRLMSKGISRERLVDYLFDKTSFFTSKANLPDLVDIFKSPRFMLQTQEAQLIAKYLV